jgi:N-acetylmuramoyl-L-alanine amidase
MSDDSGAPLTPAGEPLAHPPLSRPLSRRAAIIRLLASGAALGVGALAGVGRATTVQAAPATQPPLDPIPVRLAEVVHEGPAFRDGLADGVSPPGQGGAWTLTAEAPGASYTSPPFRLEFPCSHVGVHWRTDDGATSPTTGLRVEVRSSRDGIAWAGWRRVSVEAHGRGDDAEASFAETFGALVGGRQGSWLQYRLTFDDAWPGEVGVQRVTLTYLDAGHTPPERLGAYPDDAAFAKLGPADGLSAFLQRVIPREAWGADESLRFVDGVDQWPRAFVSPKFMVVHHTATDNTYPDPAAEIRAIYVYHTVTQGFGDIGYHMLIDNRGQVYEGRLGRAADPDDPSRREIVSRDVVAGHTLHHNYGSVGIAMLGTFTDADPSDSALQTLEEALTFSASRYAIDARTRLDFLRGGRPGAPTDLWRDDLNALSGHRDCFPTECPGNRLYVRLPGLRETVAAQIGPDGPRVRFTGGPSERTLWPTDLAFAWEGSGGAVEYSTRLEGWRLSDKPDIIDRLSGYDADERPVWGPWTRQSSAAFALPPDARGHYTLLVRARTAGGREGAYIERWPLFVDRHVLVDDADLRNTSSTGSDGTWQPKHEILGYNGTGYAEAQPSPNPTGSFVWTVPVPEDGTYRVLTCWTDGPGRTSAARYTIGTLENGRSLPLIHTEMNQQEQGGTWIELAQLELREGMFGVVIVSNEGDGTIAADAVRLVLIP